MKLELSSGTNRPSRRRPGVAPMTEACELRTLLAAGPIIQSPASGAIVTSQSQTITWSAVTNAVTYELQAVDVESGDTILTQTGITQTSFNGNLQLNQGGVRVQVRAILAGNVPTDWSAARTFTIRYTPVITGPIGANLAAPQKIEVSRPVVEWNSAPGASQYEVYLQNLSTETVKTFVTPGQVKGTVVSVQPVPTDGKLNFQLNARTTASQVSSIFVPSSRTIGFAIRLESVAGALPIQDTVTIIPGSDAGTVQRAIRALGGYENVTVTNVDNGSGITYEITFSQVDAPVTVSVPRNSTGVTPVVAIIRQYSESTTTAVVEPLSFDATAAEVQTAIRKLTGYSNAVVTRTETAGRVDFTVTYPDLTDPSTTITTVVNQSEAIAPVIATSTNVTLENRRLELAEADAPAMTKFRVFVRATDDAGNVSSWSSPFHFETTRQLRILTPAAVNPLSLDLFPKLDASPTITWAAIDNATSYNLRITTPGAGGVPRLVVNQTKLTTTTYTVPFNLANGTYTISVQAIREITGKPALTVIGNFSTPVDYRVGKPTVISQLTRVTISGAPTSGTFQLSLRSTINGGAVQRTAPIPYNATAAQLQAAIRAVPGYSLVLVQSATGIPGSVHNIDFRGVASAVTVSVLNNTTGGTLAVSITRQVQLTVPGGTTVFTPAAEATNLAAQTVTHDPFPTISWQEVDSAREYEVWIQRGTSTVPYILTRSTTSEWQFTSVIPRGDYIVWVRAYGPSGMRTGWSAGYSFHATGGMPEILIPANNSANGLTPTITWTPIQNAASYTIHFTKNDGTVIVDTIAPVGGVLASSYNANLTAGGWRIWVRAILADGSALAWSVPIQITVAAVVPVGTPELEPAIETQIVSSAVRPEAAREHRRDVAATTSAAPQAETSSDSNHTDAQIHDEAAQDREAAVTTIDSERDLKATAVLTSQTSEFTEALFFSAAVSSSPNAAEIQKSLEDVALKSLAAECENAEWWNAEKRSA